MARAKPGVLHSGRGRKVNAGALGSKSLGSVESSVTVAANALGSTSRSRLSESSA